MVLEPLLTTDLTIQQLKALSVIVTTTDGATGEGLADSLGVSMATTSKLVDRLVAQGLVIRTSDTEDHRVRRLRATPLGLAVVRELMAARPELSGHILARLDLDDLRALEQGMRAISEELRGIRREN